MELKEALELLDQPLVGSEKMLLIVMEIKMIYGPRRLEMEIVGFIDCGSGCSLIENKLAQELKLAGRPVHITITTINGPKPRDTLLYAVELLVSARAFKFLLWGFPKQ